MSANVTLIKQSNPQYAIVGTTITYTIMATNNGTIPVSNVIVNDLLPSELQFINGSVQINSNPMPLENMLLGVNIGTLGIGASKSISFDAKTLSSGSTTIPNTASSEFNYQLLGASSPSLGMSTSPPYDIYLYNADISVKKSADVKQANIQDVITYTVILKNTGNVIASNVIFKDILPKSIKLIDGSFTINGVVVNNVNLSSGINIGTIAPGGLVTLVYKVTVVGSGCSGEIINSANVSFNYTLPDGTNGNKQVLAQETASATVNVSLSTFRQISIDEYLEIPCQKPDIEAINNITGEVKILNCHVIQTQNGKSTEGQQLSGYKLIIHGVLKQVIEYTADEATQSVHSAHYDVPFSNFIILPPDFVLGSKIEVEGIVEDIYSNVISKRCFFKNTTVLLVAKILSC
ncbi:SPOCS domain-containing protein [Romboutsia sp.]|uniref:SPOCS domain-containing protein n=1 Tax=Romboutsia sp. TaxID=1965302 RepID=UPI003F3882E9